MSCIESLRALRQAVAIARDRGFPADERLRLRNEAIACLALPDLSLEKEWEGNPPGTFGLDFDARFERYAWCFKDEGIRICRLEDHRELRRIRTPPGDPSVAHAQVPLQSGGPIPGRLLLAMVRATPRGGLGTCGATSVVRRSACRTPRPVRSSPRMAQGLRWSSASPDGALDLVDLASGACARTFRRAGRPKCWPCNPPASW